MPTIDVGGIPLLFARKRLNKNDGLERDVGIWALGAPQGLKYMHLLSATHTFASLGALSA
jgi:hypothetical protein